MHEANQCWRGGLRGFWSRSKLQSALNITGSVFSLKQKWLIHPKCVGAFSEGVESSQPISDTYTVQTTRGGVPNEIIKSGVKDPATWGLQK